MDSVVISLLLFFGLALLYLVIMECKKVCRTLQNGDSTIEDSPQPLQFSRLLDDNEDIVGSTSACLRGGLYSEKFVPSRPIPIPSGRRHLKTFSERNARKARALALVRNDDEPPTAYKDLSTPS